MFCQISNSTTTLKFAFLEDHRFYLIFCLFQYASKEVECMKEAMENLKKTQGELAEFFCEDPNTFRMEDCYKSLGSFCHKFKTACSENAKRREQEALAEQRRVQREAEEQIKKSKSAGKIHKKIGGYF